MEIDYVCGCGNHYKKDDEKRCVLCQSAYCPDCVDDEYTICVHCEYTDKHNNRYINNENTYDFKLV